MNLDDPTPALSRLVPIVGHPLVCRSACAAQYRGYSELHAPSNHLATDFFVEKGHGHLKRQPYLFRLYHDHVKRLPGGGDSNSEESYLAVLSLTRQGHLWSFAATWTLPA
jgi:hypothetical protein